MHHRCRSLFPACHPRKSLADSHHCAPACFQTRKRATSCQIKIAIASWTVTKSRPAAVSDQRSPYPMCVPASYAPVNRPDDQARSFMSSARTSTSQADPILRCPRNGRTDCWALEQFKRHDRPLERESSVGQSRLRVLLSVASARPALQLSASTRDCTNGDPVA